MTSTEADRLLKALESLGKLDDFRLNNYIELARERLAVIWAEGLRRERNDDDCRLLFGKDQPNWTNEDDNV